MSAEQDLKFSHASGEWLEEKKIFEMKIRDLVEELSYKDIVIQSRETEIETVKSQLNLSQIEASKVLAITHSDYDALQKKLSEVQEAMVIDCFLLVLHVKFAFF